jgi:hypothetical protein
VVPAEGMAEVISFELILYCLIAGGVYLLLISFLLEMIGRVLKTSRGIPAELLESTGWTWFAISYIMEFLFFVFIPTFAYGFLYLILPLSGIRAGMAGALFAFTLGVVPALMGLAVRLKLSMLYLLYFLLGLLLKLAGALTIIGYLYSL